MTHFSDKRQLTSTTINFHGTKEEAKAAMDKYRPKDIKEWGQEIETHS